MLEALKKEIWYRKKEFWRNARMFFPSPAEVHFVRLFGGKAFTIDFIKHPKTRFPLTIIYSRGKFLKRNFMQREVRVGAMYIDFAFVDPYSKKGIEVDGSEYHKDYVKDRERDLYLNARGWIVMHISPADMYRQPGTIQRKVLQFLAR